MTDNIDPRITRVPFDKAAAEAAGWTGSDVRLYSSAEPITSPDGEMSTHYLVASASKEDAVTPSVLLAAADEAGNPLGVIGVYPFADNIDEVLSQLGAVDVTGE